MSYKNMERFAPRRSKRAEPAGPDPLTVALDEIDALKAHIKELETKLAEKPKKKRAKKKSSEVSTDAIHAETKDAE